MKKIIVVKWDATLGPQPLLQYPPDPHFPEKEVFLRIWAHYDMNKNSSIVELIEKEEKFLSIAFSENNEIWFLILQLESNDEFSKFKEIISKISKTLFSAINTPKINRLIPEIYTTIAEYSNLSNDQLFFNLFSDKDRIFILNILRNGVIDKTTLSKILKNNHGISESNIDILLNPLFNLNLIVEENLPGIDNCLFLVNDVYFCRLPASYLIEGNLNVNSQGEKMYLSEVTDFYKNYTPETYDLEVNLVKISKIFSDSKRYKLLQKLGLDKMKKDTYLSHIENDFNTLRELKQMKLIVEIEDFIYPMAEIHFFKFIPIYLLSNLKERYLKEEISTDQFIRHIKLIKAN